MGVWVDPMIRYGEEVETIFLSDEFIFTRSTLFISYIVLSAAKLAEFEIVCKILRHYYQIFFLTLLMLMLASFLILQMFGVLIIVMFWMTQTK